MEELPLVVVKRSGAKEPFDRTKIVSGVLAAAKGRPVTPDQVEVLASDVEDRMRLEGLEVSVAQVGTAVLESLRAIDEVAYMRFASVYKGFDAADDFQRELNLLAKGTAPKAPR